MDTVEFRRSLTLPLVGLLGAATGMVGAIQSQPWFLLLTMAGLVIGIPDLIWQRRNPLLLFSPSQLEIRLAFLGRNHQLSYVEVAGWASSKNWLGIETLQSKRIYVPLRVLTKASRERLIEHMQSLNLGQPGFGGITRRDLERRHRTVVLAAVVGAIAAVVAGAWYASFSG